MLKGSSLRRNHGNCAQRRALRGVCQTPGRHPASANLNPELRVSHSHSQVEGFRSDRSAEPLSALQRSRRQGCGPEASCPEPPYGGPARRVQVYIIERGHRRVGQHRRGRPPLSRRLRGVAEAQFDPRGELDVHPAFAVVAAFDVGPQRRPARRRGRATCSSTGPGEPAALRRRWSSGSSRQAAGSSGSGSQRDGPSPSRGDRRPPRRRADRRQPALGDADRRRRPSSSRTQRTR